VPTGGFGLIVWGDGSVPQLASAAGAQGCTLRSAWVASGGQLTGHLVGASALVNARFAALYPEAIAANVPLIIVCDTGSIAAPPAGAFRTLQGATINAADLNGRALLLGGSTRAFIGAISGDRGAPDSVCNPLGQYGSAASLVSVRNRSGPYGHADGGSIYAPYFDSQVSAYSRTANTPPQIILAGIHVGFLSANGRQATLHPDALFAALGCP